MANLRDFPNIPLKLPREEILRRMGYNRHLTKLPQQQGERIEQLMENAFSLCHVSGRLLELPINALTENAVESSGLSFLSRSLAQSLNGATVLVVMAATAGRAISQESAEYIAKGDGVAGLIYDAVGSETADVALDWLQGMLRRELPRRGLQMNRMRFSPGYGDLALTEQRKIYKVLNLQNMGIQLTESCIMLPEKSVAAISGLIPLF